VGSLAAGRVIKGDWPGVWEAVFVYLLSAIALWRDTTRATSPLEVGINIDRTRRDIPRHRGPVFDPIDGRFIEPLVGALAGSFKQSGAAAQ
jgi:hypothetical protein